MSHAAPSTATLCMAMNEQQTIRAIFAGGHTVAVVGLSPKAWRESFGVSRAMQAAGWRIIPVNPVVAERGETILGEKAYATLADAALHESIDLVNVFRNSEDVPVGPGGGLAMAIRRPGGLAADGHPPRCSRRPSPRRRPECGAGPLPESGVDDARPALNLNHSPPFKVRQR